jgi:tetratricopeptide (TPR) repeat protein
VRRAWKWVITLAAGAGVFALTWWVCARLLAIDAGDALGIAALPSSLVTLPLAWWAGREPVNATAVPPPAVTPGPGQIVVGPVPREPQHFQRREQVDKLARLAESSTLAVVCAVTGQRGVGKTQLVGAYARQRITEGWLVAWIPSETADAVTAGLGELADAFNLRREGDDDATVLARVRSLLQTRRDPALLVFDNVANPDHVTPHLPATGSVQIVLTSATHAVERLGTRVPVDLFSPDIAAGFLISTTGIRDEQGARALADKLGYLPLALAQAAARIARPPPTSDYGAYLHRLESLSLKQALTARPGEPYPLGAAEAILLAVEPFLTVETAAELAMLDLLSVLSPDGVSRELLDADDDLLHALFEASLIEFAGGTGDAVVVMHRLTQRVLRERVDHDVPAVLDHAARLLDEATFPPHEAWQRRDLGDEIVRHIDALWEHTRSDRTPASVTQQVLALRRWAVRQLIDAVALDRAVRLAEVVHADHRRIRDDDDPDRLSSLHDLATAYQRAGRLDKAIPLYEQALTTARRLFGDDDPNVLFLATNLGGAFRDAGRLDEASTLLEQTLSGVRRVLGDDDLNTWTSAGHLAAAYREAGRLDEAIPLFEQGYATARRLLGDDDPGTLNSADALACAYHDARQLDKAIQLLEPALTTARRQLGDNHPFTLRAASNLAGIYGTAGRLDEAIPLYERTLSDQRRLFGEDDLDAFFTASSLAKNYQMAGRLDEAIRLFERTLADRRRVLGDDHPDTIMVAGSLVLAYDEARRLDESIALCEQTLDVSRRVFGDDNPFTLGLARTLAESYRTVGRPDQAIPLHEQTFTVQRRILGDTHPHTVASAANLASAYYEVGRPDVAIPYLERAFVEAERLHGDDHPSTLTTAYNLACAYRDVGRRDEAILLYTRTGKIAMVALGTDHPIIDAVQSGLRQLVDE